MHLESWAYYDRPDSMIVAFTNNLLDRVHFTFNQGYQGDVTRVGVYLLNNLVRGGSLTLHSGQQGSAWVAQDNLFHSSLLEVSGLQLVHSHNGYYDTPYLSGSDIGNVSIDVPDFLPGPLGRFYYPVTGTEEGLASLRGAGSRSASAAGLYHFTTTPNQVKTGNSTVDIGMHYSVVAGGGLASDFDADGIADYIEDSDGNGLTGLGETDWTQYDSVNALLEGELSVFTPLE